GQLADAVNCYRQALRINPNHAGAYNNLGNVLKEQGQLADAVNCYRQALRINPNHADSHYNLGIELTEQGQLAEAVNCYRQTLRINPNHAVAHRNLGQLCLLQANFEEGWPEWEWRWQTKEFPPRSFSQLRWDGSSLEGRTILLHA